MRKALSLVSQNNSPARAEYNKDLGRVYLAMNKLDSALLYTNVALQNGYLDEPACNILKGNIYLKMHRLEDAEQLFMKYIGKLPLNERHDIYYKMSLLKKNRGISNRHASTPKKAYAQGIRLKQTTRPDISAT